VGGRKQRTAANPNRVFFACPLRTYVDRRATYGCGFFHWWAGGAR